MVGVNLSEFLLCTVLWIYHHNYILFVSLLVWYSAPLGERSIMMSASVCMSACVYVYVFVCPRSYLWNYVSDLQIFLCMLPMAVAWSSSGGIVIHYIFLLLSMMSYLHISWGCWTSPPGWGSEPRTHMQTWAWRVGILVAGSRCLGLILAVRAY